MKRRTPVVAVLLLAVGAGGGCSVVDRPDVADWDHAAELALDGATSEVATTRLALETAAEERTWSAYTTVLVAQAEEGIGTVEDDLSRLQVPAERTERAEKVLTVIGNAVTAVEDARALAVAGTYDDPALARGLDDLDDVVTALERAGRE